MNPSLKSPLVVHTAFDRTRSLFDLPKIETITPIGKLCQTKTIEQMCYDSTKYIIDAAGTKKIVITWSGGIDSTLVLSEFIKIAPKDQLVVMINENSILEYPEYYEKNIKGKLETTTMDFHTTKALRNAIKDGVVVTGHLMDPVFGVGMYQVMPQQRLQQKIPDFLSEVDKFSQESYTRFIKACPREIVNVKDFFWWFDYTCNYQSEQLMWLLEIEDMILDKNLFHFGASSDWNDYAVSTPAEVKYPGYNFENYKMPLKEELYKFTKDREYTEKKIKVSSWRSYRTKTQIFNEMPMFITTDWERGWNITK
jgi:hypothetical protein